MVHFIWCSTSSICFCVWWFCINVFLAKRCSNPKVCNAFLIWFGLRLEKKHGIYITKDISSVLGRVWWYLMQCCHFHIFIFFFSARFFPSSVYIPCSILVCGSSISCFLEYVFFPQKKKHHVPLENFGTISKKMKTLIFPNHQFWGAGIYHVLVFRGGPSGTPWPPETSNPKLLRSWQLLDVYRVGNPQWVQLFFFGGGEIFWGWTKMPGGDGFLRWCLICFFCFPIVR